MAYLAILERQGNHQKDHPRLPPVRWKQSESSSSAFAPSRCLPCRGGLILTHSREPDPTRRRGLSDATPRWADSSTCNLHQIRVALTCPPIGAITITAPVRGTARCCRTGHQRVIRPSKRKRSTLIPAGVNATPDRLVRSAQNSTGGPFCRGRAAGCQREALGEVKRRLEKVDTGNHALESRRLLVVALHMGPPPWERPRRGPLPPGAAPRYARGASSTLRMVALIGAVVTIVIGLLLFLGVA